VGLAGPCLAAKALPPLNQRVLDFALEARGKQVGNGECWTLADRALANARAQRPGTGGLGRYDFGRRLGRGEALLPGDIMQFEKARFEHRGSGGTSWQSLPRHTAIVYRVSGTRVTVLHQNVGGKRTVQVSVINLAERTQGTVQVYRPQPRK
jgi:hypothetical protein